MDENDIQALAEWQVDGPLSEHAHLRGIVKCPICHEGYGRASLPIHVRRCRERLSSSAIDDANGAKQKKKVRTLVNLCLQIVTKHFESICMKWMRALPEAEGALLSSMPSHLVHRMVINLIQENKQVKMINRQLCSTNKMLESSLRNMRRETAQLERARDNAAISRVKVACHEQSIKLLRQEVDRIKNALSSANLVNHRLRLQSDAAEKKNCRLVAKINKLTGEKAKSTESLSEAVRRHNVVTRELASAKKALKTAENSERISRHSNQKAQDLGRQVSLTSGSFVDVTKFRTSTTYRKRPRADGSKIPYPASFKKENNSINLHRFY